MKKILERDDKTLRLIAKEVLVKDISTLKIKKVLKEMSQALASQSDGVAIAAPQIGYSLRIFTVSGKIFDKDFIRSKAPTPKGVEVPTSPTKTSENVGKKIKDLVFINPR